VRRQWNGYTIAAVLLVALAGAWGFFRSEQQPGSTPSVMKIDGLRVVKLPDKHTSELVLTGSSEFKAGQLITTPPGPFAPEGFLLRVVSSQISDDETTVVVRPASLFEAVPSGSLVVNQADFSHYVEPEVERHLETVPEPLHGVDHVRARFSAMDPTPEAGHQTVPFDLPLACDGAHEMYVRGSIDTTLAPHFKLSWKRRASARAASLRVDGRVHAEVKAQAMGEAKCELEKKMETAHWLAFVPVGPVVVPVTFGLPIKLSADASVHGAAWASIGAGAHGHLGVEYVHGTLRPTDGFGYEQPAIDWDVEAKAGASVKVGPQATATVGWRVPALGGLAATAGVGIYSGVDFTYDAARRPPAKTCVPLKLEGEVSFELPGRRKLKPKPIPIEKKDLWCDPPEREQSESEG
jgi:hypothetical protein